MLMSYLIQSCNISAIGYEAESMPKIEFSSCRITFRGNVSCKKSSFSYGELNVVLAIQFSCRHIKRYFRYEIRNFKEAATGGVPKKFSKLKGKHSCF